MRKQIFSSILMAAGIVVMSTNSFAQQGNKSSETTLRIPVKKGSFSMNVKAKALSKAAVANDLAQILGLSNKHSFVQLSESTDKLGFTRTSYQQYFDGVLVEGGLVLVHTKAGVVNSMNGKVAPLGNLSVTPAFKVDAAEAFAKKDLQVIKLMNQYPAQLVVAGTDKSEAEYALAYKVRIDAKTADGKVVMQNVFVDAQSGKILKKINLIAHADVPATAHTKYSGVRSITTDSYTGGYRLRDNARKIETYDVAGKEMADTGSVPFVDPRDYSNAGTTWDEQPALMNMTLLNVTNTMLTGLGFQQGKFVSSFVTKGASIDIDNLATWPDVKLSPVSTQTLPISSSNVYVFPEAGEQYMGSFGKLDLLGGTGAVSDTANFPISDWTVGSHAWVDINGNAGTYQVSSQKNPALDAHWGMEQTHDYYTATFNRDSYDGNGSVVRNYINGIWPNSLSQNNAAALPAPYFSMIYGMGDGEELDAFVGLDVMGHEFTHMVTESNGTGGLDYQGESGALNESFSDIFGAAIEFFSKGNDANWLVGEDMFIDGGFLRSMEQPKLAADPDTYKGRFWASTTSQEDNGGVHTNSGVQNKWFYLLSEGGSGTNDNNDAYNVPSIGMEMAEQIAYRNLTTYLTPTSTYEDAYRGSLQATEDLYGDTSAAYAAVEEAWFAVGVGDRVVGVNDVRIAAGDLNLYPNPATSRVTVSSSIEQNMEAQIVNIVGVPVMKVSISKGLNPIDISTLAKGIYLIKYDTGKQSYVQKLSVL